MPGSGLRGSASIFQWSQGGALTKRTQMLLPEYEGYARKVWANPDRDKHAFRTQRFRTGHNYNSDFGRIDATSQMVSDTPTLTTGGTAQRVDFTRYEGRVDPCVLYTTVTYSNPEVVLNDQDPDAVEKITEERAQDAAEVLARIMETSLWHPGDGSFAEVQSAAGAGTTSVQVKRDDQTVYRYIGHIGAEWAWVNRVFRPYRNGAPVGAQAYIITGVSVNPGTGNTPVGTGDCGYDTVSFRPALDAALQNGDVLVPADVNRSSYNAWPVSLWQLYDPAVAPNLFGLDRMAEARLGCLPECDFAPTAAEGVPATPAPAHTQVLTHPLLHRWLRAYALSHGGKRLPEVLANAEVLDNLAWEGLLITSADVAGGTAGTEANQSVFMASQNTGVARGPGNFAGGVETFRFAHPMYGPNATNFVGLQWMQKSILLGHDPSAIIAWEREPWHLLDEPKGGWRPNAAIDASQHNWRWMGQVCAFDLQRCAFLRNIRTQYDAIRRD